MDLKDIAPQDFVLSFLKAAYQKRIQATVIYQCIESGRIVTRMVGNRGEAGNNQLLESIRGKPDLKAVARALHEMRATTNPRQGCLLCGEMGFPLDAIAPYPDISKGAQHKHEEAAKKIIAAMHTGAPRIIDPNAPPAA